MVNFIHYVLTYIPIIGSVLGGYFLSNSLIKGWESKNKLIYLLFLFCSICSIYLISITKFQNISEKLQLSNSNLMSEKILFIYLSVASFSFLGVFSFLGLFTFKQNNSKQISLAIIISILALFSAIFSIRSEYIQSSWKFYTTYSIYKSKQPTPNNINNEKIRK